MFAVRLFINRKIFMSHSMRKYDGIHTVYVFLNINFKYYYVNSLRNF